MTEANSAAVTVPRDEYRRRRAAFLEEAKKLARRDRRLSRLRAVLFLAGIACVPLAARFDAVAWWWCLVPAVAFLVAVVRHESVAKQLAHARRGIVYHRQNLKRFDRRWQHSGVTGRRYLEESHPYAGDLDLFGRGSLFQLLCQARTRLGEDTLGSWLLNAATPSTIDFRQRAITELRDRVDLREALALLPAEVHDALDQTRLRAWAAMPPHDVPRHWLLAAWLLCLAAIVAGFGWVILGWPLAILVTVAVVELLVHAKLSGVLRRVARDIDTANSGLAILSQVLAVLEKEQFQSPFLTALRSQLDTDRRLPSAHIRRLQRMSEWIESAWHNQFFAPFAFLLCLPILLAHAIERWRETVGQHVEQWLDAVGQFEAISSLAGYAYEHPRDPFPEITAMETVVDATGLGHPLIAEDRCVRNDLRFGREPQLMMVSGSNMSGKSTLLRTVGCNVVLALAGAPVRATRLRLSPFVLATSLSVHDSLLAGSSYFFAVISRLKAIVERTGGSTPLLFLIDEILPGTNSHDRRVGAEGIIRRLLQRGGVGLVTTHDLALTEIVTQLGTAASNVHFEDRLDDGQMTFDYQLRPGVVQRSNALELLRLVGLSE